MNSLSYFFVCFLQKKNKNYNIIMVTVQWIQKKKERRTAFNAENSAQDAAKKKIIVMDKNEQLCQIVLLLLFCKKNDVKTVPNIGLISGYFLTIKRLPIVAKSREGTSSS